MQLIIIIVSFVSISFCNAKELVTTSYSTSETEKYKLENGTVHTNIKSSGLWTNNLGNYGKNKCFGLMTTNKNRSVSLNVKCELIDHKGNKNWSVLKRNSDEFGAGVGVVEYLDGTGPWKSMIGIKCNYATNYFEDANYYVEKCKLTEKIYQDLSEN